MSFADCWGDALLAAETDMGNILHQLEAAEDDANLAFLRSEVARLQALADRRGEIAVDRKREIERLRLTDEEREVVERALSLAGQGERRPEKVAVIRRLLARFRP